jgi:hypothetical protein
MFFLKQHSQSQYKVLSDICAVDYPWKKKRFELFWTLQRATKKKRWWGNSTKKRCHHLKWIENLTLHIYSIHKEECYDEIPAYQLIMVMKWTGFRRVVTDSPTTMLKEEVFWRSRLTISLRIIGIDVC